VTTITNEEPSTVTTMDDVKSWMTSNSIDTTGSISLALDELGYPKEYITAVTLSAPQIASFKQQFFYKRVQGTMGSDVTSASTLTLGDGNFFQITGTTTINYITTTNWKKGSIVYLIFVNGLTINHNTSSPPANTASILISGNANIVFSAGSTITLIYDGDNWIGSAGFTVITPAYGDIFENNETGSVMNSSTKTWIGATVRQVDANGIVTFQDNPLGDRLVIGVGGSGDYEIEAKCDQTNSGGNETIMTVQVNGVNSTLQDEHASDSGDHRQITAHGIITLADNDYLMLHVVSSTPSDVITGFHVSLTAKRLS